MAENEVDPRAILREYADALTADIHATTQEEQDEAADNLIEASGRMEKNASQVARLIYDLLEGRSK